MNFLETRNYYIQPTKQGVYIFFMKALSEEPQYAMIQYDGKDAALFLRTPSQTILIDYINPCVQKQLFESGFVVIAEINPETEALIRDYKVPLRQVSAVNKI